MKFTPDMITQDMITAAENVFVAMAFAETIRPIVRKYQTRILKRHQYHISPEFTRYGEPDKIILNPEDSWLLADADFQVYHAECKKARDAAKLKVENDDFCPLLVAESLQRDAEHALVAAMEPLTGLSADQLLCSALDNYKKYLDLTLKLLAPFVKQKRAA